MRDAHVEEIPLKSARQFMAELRPGTALKVTGGPFIFRGQADASWGLVSTAWRREPEDKLALYLKAVGHVGPSDDLRRAPGLNADDWDGNRRRAELFALQAFVRGTDWQGLLLPEDTGRLRDKLYGGAALERVARGTSCHWPTREHETLLAVAQHYGVPTRLLDWTERGLVAAYFAAEDCVVGEKNKSGHLAVWAIELHPLQRPLSNRIVRLVRVPTGVCPNLALQQGLFTCVRMQERAQPDRAAESLEKVVGHDFRTSGCGKLPRVFKLTLAVQHAPALLRWLATENVHGGTVTAGHHGAAAYARECVRWDQPPTFLELESDD